MLELQMMLAALDSRAVYGTDTFLKERIENILAKADEVAEELHALHTEVHELRDRCSHQSADLAEYRVGTR